ncbi:MAG: glucose-6-phosphate isomerase [Candidatus Shapirobacteria bacterium]|nr:glucose-6-phosphate isomerase [Candidatus Shapirobacteria bacterium]
MANKEFFDESYLKDFVNGSELEGWGQRVKEKHEEIRNKTGEGNDFLGWVDLPINYDKEEFGRIKMAAEKIRSDSEALVVIGIGGSYLGAKAVIEALEGDGKTKIYFAGNDLSSKHMNNLLKELEGKEVSLNVISKSGTTTESAVAFRILREWMENKYGEKANKRIYATTDSERGVLKELANKKGYETFVVPDDVGGRYSVLTAVGLLPIAAAGINIDDLMCGAEAARQKFDNENLAENEAYRYAVYRNIFYQQGKLIEVLANYEPNLHYVGEWWKQLFGESEGKDKKGIFPAAVDFTTDLHSMGQYIQDGNRILMETVLSVEEDNENLIIRSDLENLDGLNYLAGKSLDEINKTAMEATIAAHTEGGVPNMVIRMPKLDAFNLGYTLYFFEKACAMSGYLLEVNPFNQPGVEVYKKKMFVLLGKE